LFFVLIGLIIPATFAILPYTLNLQDVSPGWEVLLIDRLINALLIALLGGIGMLLANRIGLGMPFAEGWVKREPVPYRLRNIAAIAWVTAVGLVLLSMFLHSVVLDPPLNAMLDKLDIPLPETTTVSPLRGFLASLSAGITEETLFRLFGLSLLAWLGGLLFHDSDGRPKPIVFWVANVLFALAFGTAHLPTEAALGLSMNPLVVTSTLILNGIGGLAFGWLFWTFGLESAMLAHFLADAIKLTLIPFITMQEGETARYLVIVIVVVAVSATLIWACRSLLIEGRRSFPQMMHEKS
jgi:hypothetical protein